MGGSWSGSPTARSFLQLNLEIGRRLCGSNIWEHSSKMTILNCIFFITSNPVLAHVAPMTLFDVSFYILDCIFSFLISAMLASIL
jgi:hypothetical protein